MANEKRLIDLDELVAHFRATKIDEVFPNWKELFPSTQAAIIRLTTKYRAIVLNAPIVDAVEVVQFNALKSLVNGEWVDCKLVEEALGIDFATELKMFDFSRTAEWNPAPLNGQKITTKFRLKNAEVHGRWIEKEEKIWNLEKPIVTGWECSKCGEMYGHYTYNYCPNCGAKMDGDGNG